MPFSGLTLFNLNIRPFYIGEVLFIPLYHTIVYSYCYAVIDLQIKQLKVMQFVFIPLGGNESYRRTHRSINSIKVTDVNPSTCNIAAFIVGSSELIALLTTSTFSFSGCCKQGSKTNLQWIGSPHQLFLSV